MHGKCGFLRKIKKIKKIIKKVLTNINTRVSMHKVAEGTTVNKATRKCPKGKFLKLSNQNLKRKQRGKSQKPKGRRRRC